MKSPLKEAIFKTLAYADIFDYPFKKEEIWHWLIWDRREAAGPVWKKSFASIRSKNSDKLGSKEGYYFLPGRQNLVAIRQERETYSATKMFLAQKIARRLQIIPTIKMVAVTGSLVWGNCEEDDDIDFLIVAQKNTLWLTRFLTTLLVELAGRRRRPGDKKPGQLKDKMCLNMFLDEEHLALPLKERDLYTAHEVSQLKPLWDKDNTYQKFLSANSWTRRYLPNSIELRIKNYELRIKNSSLFLKLLEKPCRRIQLWYMRKRRTREVISEGIIRFHPQDAREWVLREYETRLQKYLKFGS